MGLFSKIKDILFEEEVETEEIKETPKKEKFQLPKKEDLKIQQQEEKKESYYEIKKPQPKKTEEVSEKDLYKSEPTFPFPLAFDEDVKVKTRSEKTSGHREFREPKRKVDVDKKYFDSLKEEPKKSSSTPFKPSPVISPVYGILDKNYKKEDIQSKQHKNEKPLDIDKIRKKAFGPLETDIENTFSTTATEIKLENVENDKSIDDLLIDTISINLDQDKSKNPEKEEKNNPLDILDEIENGLDEINNKAEKEKENLENDTLETDLFNLIDSMYDKKEGEE